MRFEKASDTELRITREVADTVSVERLKAIRADYVRMIETYQSLLAEIELNLTTAESLGIVERVNGIVPDTEGQEQGAQGGPGNQGKHE